MFKKNLIISNELQDVVNKMTTAHDIVNLTDNGTNTTIITSSAYLFENYLLKSGMIIEIDNVNYEVLSVAHTANNDLIEIKGILKVGTSWSLAINYMTGTRIEVNQILQQESGNLDRFPLIWLLQPIETNFENQAVDFSADLVLVFAHKSNATDRASKRLNENINKVIQPLIDIFKLQLESNYFNYMIEREGDKEIELKQNIFPFYGTSDKKKSVLNTFTDAIEVQTQLKFKKQFII